MGSLRMHGPVCVEQTPSGTAGPSPEMVRCNASEARRPGTDPEDGPDHPYEVLTYHTGTFRAKTRQDGGERGRAFAVHYLGVYTSETRTSTSSSTSKTFH